MHSRWIYFVQGKDGGAIKIGSAANVPRRVAELQTGLPFKLVVLATRPGTTPLERELHLRLRAHRLNGEWFSPAAEVLEEVEGARAFEQASLRNPRNLSIETKVAGRRRASLMRDMFVLVLKVAKLPNKTVAAMGVSPETVKSWKKGRALPNGVALINLGKAHPLFSAWIRACIDIGRPDGSSNAIEGGLA